MKTSLLKKLYATMIASALYTIAAHAQIIYTDVDPDERINHPNQIFQLDLNNDGITDYSLGFGQTTVQSVGCSGKKNDTKSVLISTFGHEVLCIPFGGLPKKLVANDTIDSASSYWSSGGSLREKDWLCILGIGWLSGDTGDWNSASDGYAGLRFNDGFNNYYGWVRLRVSGTNSITIKDYAYNSIPNQPILAGETSCTAPTVILSPSDSLSFCKGDSVTLTANTTAYQFQWQRNGVDIAGATLQTYTAKNSGNYKCIVTNSCGSKISKGIKLTKIQCSSIISNGEINNAKAISKNTELNIAPNPFSNTTTISFSLLQVQKVSISIYDMNGRLVKTIADAQMQAGAHQLTWDAKDEKGNAVVAGIYVLKMQAGNLIETKKISVVR